MSYYLESPRIGLRTIRKSDLPEMMGLMTNHDIATLTGEVHPMTETSFDEFYERCQKTEDRIWFLIIDKATNKIIGETGLLRLYMPWRTSDFSLVIWDSNYWASGYGQEVASLMLDYSFNYLNLNRLAIGVVGFNERGLKFWKRIGFKEEGRQREGYFCKGEYSDFIMMSLLARERQ